MKEMIFAIGCLVFTSCFMNEKGIYLRGKILVETLDNSCSFYDNSDTCKLKFKLRDDKRISYSGLRWMYQEDAFIGGEYLRTKGRGVTQANIVRFDLAGKMVERIYESQPGEIAWHGHLSRNDKLFLFTTHIDADPEEHPFEGITPMLSLSIMDFKQRKVIRKIDSIGRSPNFELHESPWLYSEDRFVYSMSSENKIVHERDTINQISEAAGVYVYDVNSNQKKLIAPNGRFAIASPTNLQVAYVKDHSVWLIDLKDNKTRAVYAGGSKEKIKNIHWTPDGKYIYLAYLEYYVGDLFTSGERLIDISNGNEMPFMKIGNGFESYTWK